MLNLEKLEQSVKIELTPEEKLAAAEYFEYRLKKFEKLENIETADVEPLINAVALENVMRDDIAYKIFDRGAILENAPEQHDGYFVVPRILE